MLDVPHHHVRRFPAAGMHDSAEVDTCGSHILSGTDAHGMSREFRDKGFVKAGLMGEDFENACDGIGMKGVRHELGAADAAKNRSRIQVCSAEPALQMREGSADR
jgi:hypothetical protein